VTTRWNPLFANRPCWSCGRRPDGTFYDGSPRYVCDHPSTSTSDLFESVAVPLTVDLTADQIASARQCAERMEKESDNRRKFRDRGGLDGSNRAKSFQFTFSGIMGEVAVATFLGIEYRCATGRFGSADVAGVHVRTTRYKDGHLIIRDHERSGVYMLVVDERPRMRLVGWVNAEEARRPEFVRSLDAGRPTSYAIPVTELRDPAVVEWAQA
jgi:hypothetical protein